MQSRNIANKETEWNFQEIHEKVPKKFQTQNLNMIWDHVRAGADDNANEANREEHATYWFVKLLL